MVDYTSSIPKNQILPKDAICDGISTMFVTNFSYHTPQQ
jgi:hypothetical protein